MTSPRSALPLVLLSAAPRQLEQLFRPSAWAPLTAEFDVIAPGTSAAFDDLLPRAFAVVGQFGLDECRLARASALRRPGFVISKANNSTSDGVAPGATVTYTVTVTNTDLVAAATSFTDTYQSGVVVDDTSLRAAARTTPPRARSPARPRRSRPAAPSRSARRPRCRAASATRPARARRRAALTSSVF
ncbi:MAG: hypothetical protein ABR571_03770 [Jatrophihabitans sp.]|uniref:hypothetical protein n=1 Tax=Jatrophihabitans sp. TaxID=1932789 RepID=UPI003910E3A6